MTTKFQLRLPADQRGLLALCAQRVGCSRSELLRRAIVTLAATPPDPKTMTTQQIDALRKKLAADLGLASTIGWDEIAAAVEQLKLDVGNPSSGVDPTATPPDPKSALGQLSRAAMAISDPAHRQRFVDARLARIVNTNK